MPKLTKVMGPRIKARRKELNLSQEKLAELCDISNTHMSSIENGKENPSIEIIPKICDALKVTPDYLFLGSMHIDNVPQNIMDNLALLCEDDLHLAEEFVNLLVNRNCSDYNQNNYV